MNTQTNDYLTTVETRHMQPLEVVGTRLYRRLYGEGGALRWDVFQDDGNWGARAYIRRNGEEKLAPITIITEQKISPRTPTKSFTVVVHSGRSRSYALERLVKEAVLGL